MIEFALGFIACAILYTFWPALAVIPSGWLRRIWTVLNNRKSPE